MNRNILVKLVGYPATVLHGDAAVFDRWLWLRRNLKRGPLRTLDAGCGSGAFALYAAKRGNEAIGVSFDEGKNKIATERAALLGIKNVRFITGDLRQLDNMTEQLGLFDQIICFETIEHILGDEKLLKDFSLLLKSGGRVLLTAPYKNYAKHLLGDDAVSLSTYEDGGHVRWGYTHEEMGLLLGEAGFVVTKKEHVSGLISQLLIASYRRLQRRINYKAAWLIVFPLRILVILDPLITRIFNFPHLSIAVVGVKRRKESAFWLEDLKREGVYVHDRNAKGFSRVWRRIFRKIPDARGSVFEIGVGGGKHLDMFQAEGWETAGIDISPDVLARAERFLKKTAKLFMGDFLSFGERTQYDLVFHVGAVEHYQNRDDRIKFLEKMLDVTRDGGYAISIVPINIPEKTQGLPEIDYTSALMKSEFEELRIAEYKIFPHNMKGFLAPLPFAIEKCAGTLIGIMKKSSKNP